MGRSLLYDASDLLVNDEPVLNSENGFHSETEEPAEDEDQPYHSGEGNIDKKTTILTLGVLIPFYIRIKCCNAQKPNAPFTTCQK